MRNGRPFISIQRRIVLLLTLLSFAGVSAPAFSKELEDRKWLQVRTENFEIRSLLSKKDTIRLAQDLEIFRLVAADLTNAGLQKPTIPTVIYIVKSGSAADRFSIGAFYGGRFLTDLRQNILLVKSGSMVRMTETIVHEYVHYLIGNFGAHVYPMWLNEGLAEYFSNIQIRSNEVLFGSLSRNDSFKFGNYSWIPMRQIISRKYHEDWDVQRNSKFYSEAWALVHYLHNRTDKNASFNEQVRANADLLELGIDAEDAFESAFGFSSNEIDGAVRRYIYGNGIPALRIKDADLLARVEPEVRRMSREQISLGLGQFALRTGELNDAEYWFTIAANDEHTRALAEAGIGEVWRRRGEPDKALRYLERAIELAPNDAQVQLAIAGYWLGLATHGEHGDRHLDHLITARQHCTNAWNIDPSLPEIYALYGRTLLAGRDDYGKAVEMFEQSQRMRPSNIEVRALLAQAYLGAERPEDAEAAARGVLAWLPDDSETTRTMRDVLRETATESGDESVPPGE